MDDLDRLKIGITVGLLVGIFFICLLCYFILNCIDKRYNKDIENNNNNGKNRRQNKLFSRLNLFSGGVFFATSFLHLLPEAKEEMEKFLELASISFRFPACEFVVSIGFFLVLFAEQLTSKVHRILEAHKETKSSQANEMPVLTADIPNINSVAIKDKHVEEIKHRTKREADEHTNEALSAENKTESSDSENRDNKSISIILCNDETCAECNSLPTEKFDFLGKEPSDKKARKDDGFIALSLYTANKNDGATTSEPFGIVSDSNPSTLTLHSKGSSSLRKFQSENSLINYNNPALSPPKLVYCNCTLNNVRKYLNTDSDVTNKITCRTDSHLKKAIEPPSESALTDQASKREGYRAIILLISLLFHSLFDGLALGLQTNSAKVYTIMIAIFFHKSLVAFSLTLKFYRTFPGRVRFIFLCLFLFSLISPIGSLTGWLVSGSDSIHIVIRAGCSGILQSLATGTFLYVTFIEILGPELGHGNAKLISISFVFIGFLTIALLKFVL